MLLLDLEKKINLALEKKGVKVAPRSQVCAAIDGSGSMDHLYRNNTVQRTAERLMALACRFDDNQTLDCWAFDNDVFRLPPATPANFSTYISDCILHNQDVRIGGGTSYAPVFRDILAYYFGNGAAPAAKGGFLSRFFGVKSAASAAVSDSTDPVCCLFITDGENDDKNEAYRVLQAAQEHPIYWQMVGIGREQFGFLRRAADDLPNVGFLKVPDLNISDEDLYGQLLGDELLEWLGKKQ